MAFALLRDRIDKARSGITWELAFELGGDVARGDVLRFGNFWKNERAAAADLQSPKWLWMQRAGGMIVSS